MSFDTFDLGTFSYPEAPIEQREKRTSLTWRMDPEKSLSDFELVVVPKTTHEIEKEENAGHAVQTYHVHKNVLGAGPRSGLYFENLFRSKDGVATASIEFDMSAAEAMPAMLDYMYSATDDVSAFTTNAVALRYLASFFGIEELYKNVNVFIQSDLTPTTSPIYLAESAIYYDEKIMQASFKLCANYFGTLDEHALASFSPKLFRKVVLSSEFQCESKALSVRVAAFWKYHADLDTALLKELTDPALMPEIDPGQALFFLKLALDHKLIDDKKWGLDDKNSEDVEVVADRIFHKSSLEERSKSAASHGWDIALVEELDSANRTTILDDEDTSVDHALIYSQLSADLRINLLETALVCASSEVRQLRAELSRFARVPETHKFDEQGYVSCFVAGDGTLNRPPSAMPRLTDQKLDGYLFHADDEAWPVFYYNGN
jgi:BTB/POZ domain